MLISTSEARTSESRTMSYYNQNLTELPHLLNSLTDLSCHSNRLIKLPEQLPDTITVLWCHNNCLTRLPEQLPNLITLFCYINYLTSLPERFPYTLYVFWCHKNPFLFNLRNNLKWIFNDNKNITSFNNYKVLSKIQSKRREDRQINTKTFCRDINRLCNSY